MEYPREFYQRFHDELHAHANEEALEQKIYREPSDIKCIEWIMSKFNAYKNQNG
jgi:hypothetical protein